MRTYEMMLVLDPDMSEEQLEGSWEKVKKLIEDRDGEVLKIDKWGLQTLSYEIKSKSKGYYLLVYYKGKPELSAELDRSLRLMEEVVRHLVVGTEQEITGPADKARETEAPLPQDDQTTGAEKV